MHSFLKQSTASQTRTIGPFVDDTDFVSLEDALTIANTDIRLKKNGAADVAKNSGGATADVNGCYAVTFDATDTDTVGELHVSVKVAGALVVIAKFTVLEEAIYDMIFGASALGYIANAPVNAVQFSGSATAADNAEVVFDTDFATNYDATNDVWNANVDFVDGVAVIPGDGTAQAGGTSTITLATSASTTNDVYIGYVVEIVEGTGGGQQNVITDYVGASRLATVRDAWGVTPSSDSVYRLHAPANTLYVEGVDPTDAIRDAVVDDATRIDASALNTAAAAVGSDGSGLTEVGGTGDQFTAIPWNSAWDAEVESEVQDAIAANHLDHLFAADYDPASKPGVATALLNEMVESDGGVSRFTANALEQAPTGGSAPTVGDIADAVWTEAIADHSGVSGSTAEALAAAGGAGDPWITTLPGSYTGSQAGKILADVLADTAEIGAAGAGLTEAGGAGDQFTAIPWNAAWDAEVQSECADALVAYDGVVPADLPANFGSLSISGAGGVRLADGVTHGGTTAMFRLGSSSTTPAFHVTNSAGTAGLFHSSSVTSTHYGLELRAGLSSPALRASSTELNGVTATITGNITGNLSGSVGSVTGAVGSVTGSVGSVTGNINTAAGTITSLDALDTAQDTQHAATLAAVNAVWTSALTQSYRATGATGTAAQLLYELIAHLGNSGIAGTTKTLYELDTTTPAKTFTLNSDTTPTAIEEAS